MDYSKINPNNSKELKKAVVEAFREAFEQGLINGCTLGEVKLAIDLIGGNKCRKCWTKKGLDITKLIHDVEYQIQINRCARKNLRKKACVTPMDNATGKSLKAQHPSAGNNSQITRKEWGSAFKPAKG